MHHGVRARNLIDLKFRLFFKPKKFLSKLSIMVTNNVDLEGKTIQVLHVDDDENHVMISKRQIEKFDPTDFPAGFVR